MKSFEVHPPRNLKHIELPCLTSWSIALLLNCTSSSSCLSLGLYYLAVHHHQPLLSADSLGSGPLGRFLRNLTHLKIYSSHQHSPDHVTDFLRFTPSLRNLELDILTNPAWIEKPFDASLPLSQLRKLVLYANGRHLLFRREKMFCLQH